MDSDITTKAGIVIPAAAMVWRFSRGTGPGGQSVNTTDSRVELVVDMTQLIGDPQAIARICKAMGNSLRVVAASERSQLRNREAAIARLVDHINVAARPTKRRTATRRTAGSVRRRLEAKRKRAESKANRQRPAVEE